MAAQELVIADGMTVIELIHLRVPEFAAQTQLMLALDQLSASSIAGNVLPAFRRSIAGRFKIIADQDIGSVWERRTGDETGFWNARKIRVCVGERLVEVVDAAVTLLLIEGEITQLCPAE